MARRGKRAGAGGNHLVLIVLVLAAAGTLAAVGSSLQGPQGPSGGGGGGTPAGEPAPDGDVLTMAWASGPQSLDPAFAEDSTSANLVWNLFEPLVRLDEDLEPVPALATRWEIGDGGRRIMFFLHTDARWTNGHAVTADDFEYAWKRVLDPEVGSPLASRLFGIRGAEAYNQCVLRCRRLADAVGVDAVGPNRLVVTLAGRQPWFPATTAQVAFLPVHRPTVERFGDEWTAPEAIVSNGPFTLAALGEDSISLAKDPDWRAASRVALARVEGRVITNAVARAQAFDTGQVMALDGSGLAATDLPALREREEYEAYPALGTYLYAFNLTTVTDVRQRRAMALALDRSGIATNIVQADVAPATRVTPEAASPGPDEPAPSPWFPPDGDVAAASAELEEVTFEKEEVTLLHVDDQQNRQLALAVRDAWRAIGIETAIRSAPEETFLAFRGPLSADSVDVYQADIHYEFPDAMAGLAAWACDAETNKTNFCDVEYDELLRLARREPDADARARLYAAAEDILSGQSGELPVVPVYWHTFANLEALAVKESFSINPLGQIDLWAVEVR